MDQEQLHEQLAQEYDQYLAIFKRDTGSVDDAWSYEEWLEQQLFEARSLIPGDPF